MAAGRMAFTCQHAHSGIAGKLAVNLLVRLQFFGEFNFSEQGS